MTGFFCFLILAAIHSAVVHWAFLDSSEKVLAKLPAAGSYFLAMTVSYRNYLQAIAVIGLVPQMVARIVYWA